MPHATRNNATPCNADRYTMQHAMRIATPCNCNADRYTMQHATPIATPCNMQCGSLHHYATRNAQPSIARKVALPRCLGAGDQLGEVLRHGSAGHVQPAVPEPQSVPVQMWAGWARPGADVAVPSPSPGADVAVPVQMWQSRADVGCTLVRCRIYKGHVKESLNALSAYLPQVQCRGHIRAGTWARRCHICTSTGFTPGHICTGTGLTAATTALGLGSPLANRQCDWAHPLRHLHGDGPRSWSCAINR
jgi:hypothetical protein